MLTKYWKVDEGQPDIEIIKQAAEIIKAGGLVAFPTETVYGLGANGLSEEAVSLIYQAKGRPADNPLILHIAEYDEINKLARQIPKKAAILMKKYWPGPLTVVLKRTDIVPDIVTGGLDTVAIRMPSNNIARELIRLSGVPIAAPSANISGKPSPTNAQDVLNDMDGKIGAVLDGGAADIGVESTVVDCTAVVPIILRPGGITYEMLTETLGKVEIDPAVYGTQAVKPRAPGMKYRHYAPRAPLIVLEGQDVMVKDTLLRKMTAALAEGKKVGLLLSTKTAEDILMKIDNLQKQLIVFDYGAKDRPWQLARELYTLLRKFDVAEVDIIFAEGTPDKGIGKAVMNRLRKASGFNIIRF